MVRRLFPAAGVVLLWLFLAPPAQAASLDLQNWHPQQGDAFVVYVDANIGYLVHPDGDYFPFLVATGMRRMVRDLGMVYFAGTPTRQWAVDSETMSSGFGKTGHFLRLSYQGKPTHYGIHSYSTVDEWLQSDDRYRSLGCIVVSEDMLKVIEDTYHTNNDTLTVITSNGPQGLQQELTERAGASGT